MASCPCPSVVFPWIGLCNCNSWGLGLLRKSGRSGAASADVLGLVSPVLIAQQRVGALVAVAGDVMKAGGTAVIEAFTLNVANRVVVMVGGAPFLVVDRLGVCRIL